MKSAASPASGTARPPAPRDAPAHGHLPVLAEEAVAQLLTDPQGIYVDATFGRGGHALRILERLGAHGRLIALDRDPEARAAARSWTDPRFAFVHAEFSRLAEVLAERQVARIQGILVDLGVSSPQFDDAQRGFSLRADGPLDMRMNNERGPTAAQWLEQVDATQLARVLREYGDERFAASIAKAIVARRAAGQPVRRTVELAAVVAAAIPVRSRKDPLQHPATRTFQAIRIFLNQELEEVAMILPAALAALAPGGRLAVISFHSLEDRIVKRFIAAQAHPERAFGRLPLREAQLPRPRLRALARIEPGERSAKPIPARAPRICALPSVRTPIWTAALEGRPRMTRPPVLAALLAVLLVTCALALVTSQYRARELFAELEVAQQESKTLEADGSRLRSDLGRARNRRRSRRWRDVLACTH